MKFKKEYYEGTEYHFPATFNNAVEYIVSIQQPFVSDAAAESMKWDEIRIKRDRLIAVTDWIQMPDSPLSSEQKQAYTSYRQSLRDIPQLYSNPDNIVWPQKPEVE